MYDPIAYEALKQLDGQNNPYNPGGLNMREPAKGTVARGKLAYYAHVGAEDAEAFGNMMQNPLQATEANLADGKILYTRICSHCHGETGAGDGLVAEKFKGVPNFQAGRYATLPQGHVYHVITNGRGRMMPHGSQVDPEERWKIALYVQQLQQGEAASTPVDVPQGADPGASSIQNTNPVTGTEQNPDAQPAGN
jgi:mono/diheme cytochrome c family protein